MQKCPNCGTEISTNYCYNCGWQPGYPTEQKTQSQNNADYNHQAQQQQNISYQAYSYTTQANDGFLGNNSLSYKNGTSATVKAIDWFKFCGVAWLLYLIPFVGGIASLVYQIVMLCRQTTAPSIRGYLKFQFIMSAAIIAFVIALLIIVGIIVSSKPTLSFPSDSFNSIIAF